MTRRKICSSDGSDPRREHINLILCHLPSSILGVHVKVLIRCHGRREGGGTDESCAGIF